MPSLTEPITRSAPTDRASILREIAFHERCAEELRASLPPTIRKFYKFRCRPDSKVMVYAEDEAQARQRLSDRMNANYPSGGWAIVSTVVESYDDPQVAAMQVSSNLLRAISPAEAREFIRDYRASQAGRPAKPALENVGMSTIDREIEDFERWERQQKG